MAKGKILVVDDEPEIVQSLTRELQSAGYEVATATDGLSATKLAIAEQPELIIMDIGLPAGHGHVVVEQLRNIEDTSHIPVIFLTACTSEEDYRLAQSAGSTRYLAKTCESEALLQAVAEQLRRVRQPVS